MGAISLGIGLAEGGLLPDTIVRTGIRGLVRERLAEIQEESCEEALAAKRNRYAAQSQGPIAVETDLANEQHYEVAPAFFEQVLGRHLKYSCGFWEGAETDLDSSESAMLRLSCERAEMQDGMRVLDLGCGIGGPLRGVEGWVEGRHGMSTVLLRLDFIGKAAAVKMDAELLELI